MRNFFDVTLKSILRDRVFHGIGFAAFLFLLIPSVASLSMRQMTELSINLSLSLLSFILLLLALFLGGDLYLEGYGAALHLQCLKSSC